MSAEFVTAKTAEGYDVVDPSTGLVVGQLERINGVYAKPEWIGRVLINGGHGFEGPSLYHPIFQSRHGECSIAKMAAFVWKDGAGYRRALAKRKA